MSVHNNSASSEDESASSDIGMACEVGDLITRLAAGKRQRRVFLDSGLDPRELVRELEIYTSIVDLYPWHSFAVCHRAGVLMGLRRNAEAFAEFSRALELDPDNILARRGRADMADDMGHFDLALRDLDQLVKPTSPPCLIEHRAILRARCGLHDLSLADYARIIELEPRLPFGYYNRGLLYHDLGLYHLAKADYEAAMRVHPGHMKWSFQLAWLLATCPSDEVRDAISAQCILESIQSDLDHLSGILGRQNIPTEGWWYDAPAYIRPMMQAACSADLGNFGEAKELLAQARSLCSDGEDLQRIDEYLREVNQSRAIRSCGPYWFPS